MKVSGVVPVQYTLTLGEEIPLNSLLGKKISLKFLDEINCIACGQNTKKSYQNGYCGRCVKTLAECDICIVRPEKCHYEDGTCREPEWGRLHCMIPHYVYLSYTSGLKVGITRHTQLPTRWIDQGALAGLPILKVSSRFQSGMFETLLGEVVSDKTHWQKMLRANTLEVDLKSSRDDLFEQVGEGLDELEEEFGEDNVELLEEEDVVLIDYPVLEYPEKVKSLTMEKISLIEGTLLGIKGQYLILDTGVVNIRRHSGYKVEFQWQ